MVIYTGGCTVIASNGAGGKPGGGSQLPDPIQPAPGWSDEKGDKGSDEGSDRGPARGQRRHEGMWYRAGQPRSSPECTVGYV